MECGGRRDASSREKEDGVRAMRKVKSFDLSLFFLLFGWFDHFFF